MTKAPDAVLAYHQRSKHHFQRYAAGPEGLDWANQPDPFRTFMGCPQILLPLLADEVQPRFVDLYLPGKIASRPLTPSSIAALLALSFGISAWKQYGESRWALRCNPSSGNLHPTEAYVVAGGNGLADGVYHYLSRDHLLEQRCVFATDHKTVWRPRDTLLLGLTSIHWREAWKYGERAFRYCQHDVGHAIAAVRYAAAVLGWQVRLLDHWGDADIAAILGTDRTADFGAAEAEYPDLMLQITAAPTAGEPLPAAPLVSAARDGTWQGKANRLSRDHTHQWPVIDEVAHACHRPAGQSSAGWSPPTPPAPLPSPCTTRADALIRQRRSAQAFDGKTPIDSSTFYRMLDMSLPRAGVVPWDTTGWQPRIHLLLFVHRVAGLAPGLYLLLREHTAESRLKPAFGREFDWLPVAGSPPHLTFYRLLTADAREAAQTLSCHQEIAADGAFSLAMLAEFEATLDAKPWRYRELFWEAGMIGQVLYLEAEAAAVRGTGIGCYFDDGVHDMLGLQDLTLQSLYHFTVGTPLTDNRLQTLPAYAHLQGRRPSSSTTPI